MIYNNKITQFTRSTLEIIMLCLFWLLDVYCPLSKVKFQMLVYFIIPCM